VRDTRLQVFAAGTSPSHAFVHIVGFGAPVEIAGLTIAPGDLLFGDRHGLVSLPPASAPEVARIAAAMNARERHVIDYCRAPAFSVERLRDLVADWE